MYHVPLNDNKELEGGEIEEDYRYKKLVVYLKWLQELYIILFHIIIVQTHKNFLQMQKYLLQLNVSLWRVTTFSMESMTLHGERASHA